MRGVHLPAGKEHKIQFDFKPKIKGLYISLSAILLGVVLCGCVGGCVFGPCGTGLPRPPWYGLTKDGRETRAERIEQERRQALYPSAR